MPHVSLYSTYVTCYVVDAYDITFRAEMLEIRTGDDVCRSFVIRSSCQESTGKITAHVVCWAILSLGGRRVQCSSVRV